MANAPKALFIGLTTVDVQYFVEQFPHPNQKVKAEQPHLSVGGPSANAAIACATMGIETHFLTCIGTNAFTTFIHADFKKQSVLCTDMQEGEEFSPIIASVITNTNTSERAILTHHPNKLNHIPEVCHTIDLAQYSLIFTDGFYAEAAIPICNAAKKFGIPVVFDGGSWKPTSEQMLKHVDIAICSQDFLPPHCIDHKAIFEFIHNQGVSFAAISRGGKSILWSNGRTNGEIEIKLTGSIDSLGAGDILHGAFSVFLLQGNNYIESLEKASFIASYSTLFKGTREWIESYDKVSFD
jgi:sugar/nucleoside kinase (ribokinase family)